MDDKKDTLSEIIAYLNQRTGSHFRPSSDSAARNIGARLAEGRTLEDFRLVIDSKVSEWLGNPPWDAYLRPRTLFGTKFDGYLETARRKQKAAEDQTGSGFRSNAGELLD